MDGVLPKRTMIEGYGKGSFRISGDSYEGSVLLSTRSIFAWDVTMPDDISAASLEPLLTANPDTEILLIGAGTTFSRPDPELQQSLRARGIIMDMMDTGAACRTFNVLAAEDRNVAAALIAV